jgi:tRNA/tmRNA/rRNA uracil-C5-methylase (TrmA/RlmC/RlmD family)
MHLSAAGELAAHTALWRQAIAEAGGDFDPGPLHQVPGELSEVRVQYGISDQGHPRIGVLAREGNGLVAIPECLKLSPLVRSFMGAAMATLRTAEVRPGGSILGLRCREIGGELLVGVKVAKYTPAVSAWAPTLASTLRELRGVVAEFPPEEDRMGLGWQKLYGHDTLEWSVLGFKFKLGAEEHLPRHLPAYASLLEAAPRLLGVTPGDAVLDLGAHIGVRTAVLARAAGWAFGVEPEDRPRLRAVENAARNGVSAEFASFSWPEAIEDAAPRLQGRRPLVWIDTGRKELGARVVEAVRQLDPRRVALQGSNPHALAREIVRWTSAGWRFVGMERWDVDPHAPFAEAVAVVESADLSAPEKRAPRRRTVR